MTPRADASLDRTCIAPTTTLAAALEPGAVYVPRRSPHRVGWGPAAPGQVDAQTAAQLTVAGPVAYVVCAGGATPAAFDLLRDAGLPVEAEILPYATAQEHATLVARLAASGRRLALQRPHPEDEAPASACTVAPQVLADLNDKGLLRDLAPANALAVRRVVATGDLPSAEALVAQGPVVLKAATALPTGGGHGVFVVRSVEDATRAIARLAASERVVIEELLDLRRSVCVHAVVLPSGEVRACGVAEEVVEDAKWRGNWLDAAADAVPDAALQAALHVVRAGAARGYRGVVGVDVALVGPDETPRVLDANFRVNGSTAAAWLRPAIERARGPSSIRGRAWTLPGPFADLLRIARDATARGALVPLAAYDPEVGATGGSPRLIGLLVGPTREHAEEEDRRLASLGLA